jgi:prephenate dehydrogenase
MIKTAVLLGSSGQVGSLLSPSLHGSGVEVLHVDRGEPPAGLAPDRFLQADVARPSPALRAAVAAADCVLVCLPEDVAMSAAETVLAAMAKGSLWVDTLSVKTPIGQFLRGRIDGVEALSINPMFAPALGWRGNGVAVVEIAGGPKSRQMLSLIESWGAHCEILSVEGHDGMTAAVQVATHAAVIAFGAVLLDLGYDVEACLGLATPPHRLMMALLSRIVHANPEVYADIQKYHPESPAVWQAMSRAVAVMQGFVSVGEADPFPRLFQDLRGALSTRREELKAMSDRVIREVSGSREPTR